MDESLLRKYPQLEESHFWWVTRRMLLSNLIAGMNLGESPRVLDVGCGNGVLASELATDGAHVTAVDLAFSGAIAQSSRKMVDFREGDYVEMAQVLGEFDLVLALDTIEHVQNEAAILEAIRNNMRPGAHTLITVPAYHWLWSKHDEDNGHFRRYTRARLMAALERAGLDIVRSGYLFFGLIGPKALAGILERSRNTNVTMVFPSTGINRLAMWYFELETRLAMQGTSFLPAGTSVIAIARRSL